MISLKSWKCIWQCFFISIAHLGIAPVRPSLINTRWWPAQLICSATRPFMSLSIIIFTNRMLFLVTFWAHCQLWWHNDHFQASIRTGLCAHRKSVGFSEWQDFLSSSPFFHEDCMLSLPRYFCSIPSVVSFHEIGLSGLLWATLTKLGEMCYRVIAQRKDQVASTFQQSGGTH